MKRLLVLSRQDCSFSSTSITSHPKTIKSKNNQNKNNMTDNTTSKDPWVVVTSFWPTYRVCNGTSEVELLQSPYSTISLEGGEDGFETKKEAIVYAISQRDRSGWFEGWAEMHDEYDEDDEDDEGDKDDISIDESVDQWCSSDLENEDNDEEQIIKVMLLSEYNEEKERRNKILKKAYEEQLAKTDAARCERAQQIRRAGRVFYSFPPPPRGYDIPADVELLICNGKLLNVPRKDQLHFKDEGQVAPFDISRLTACKSIELQAINSKREDIMKVTELIFASCKDKLEEFHWIAARDVPYIIGSNSGPHARECMQNLKVLSLPFAWGFDPDDLVEVSKFPSLERLDLRSSLDMQHGMGIYYDDSGRNTEMPYSEAFLTVCQKCEHLNHIDLGDIMTELYGFSVFAMTLDRFVLIEAHKKGIKLKLGDASDDEESDDEESDDY